MSWNYFQSDTKDIQYIGIDPVMIKIWDGHLVSQWENDFKFNLHFLIEIKARIMSPSIGTHHISTWNILIPEG